MTYGTSALTRCEPVWKGSIPGLAAGLGLAVVGFFAAPFLRMAARPVGAAAKEAGEKAAGVVRKLKSRTAPEYERCGPFEECTPDTL